MFGVPRWRFDRVPMLSGSIRFSRWALLPLVVLLSVGSAPRVAGSDAIESADMTPTIVLLHGLGRSARNMLILKWRLQGRGYDVCNVNYDTRVASLEEAADAVHESIVACATTAAPIHFVTHSLGGLVLRSLLARHALTRAGRAVMLAPPNAGSEIADRFRGSAWTRSILGPLADQLGTGADDLPNRLPIPSIPFGVIAGDQWINPAGPFWLPSPHDGTVSVASTRLPGMTDHIVLPYTHTFIMNSARVTDQIEAFLQKGQFLRSADPSQPGSRGRSRHGQG